MRCWHCVGLMSLLVLSLAGCSALNAPLTPGTPQPGARGGGATTSTARPATVSAVTPALADLADEPAPPLLGDALPELERGAASWYGLKFHGRRTASGERFDMNGFTAAHRTLPFGTLVRVRSLVNGREVEVRINDRGPHVAGRIIDLSRAAAEALGMLGLGMKPVTLSVAGQAQEPPGQELQTPKPAARAKTPRRKRPLSARRS